MSAALQKPMDVEQFLAWEERQELRFEFDGLRAIARTGGTGAHAAIQVGLLGALGNHLRGKRPRAFGSGLRIKMSGSVRYPDAFVICTPVSPAATFATEPAVIFEILSKSTAREDFGAKHGEYAAIATLQRYVLLQQTHSAAFVFSRTTEGWDYQFIYGADAILDMPEIGVAIPLGEIYEDIVLESDPAAG